jgi:NAD(P)-dependent dehydrogenase (short-subunit alcohol dehydrogenase family)
MPHAILLGASRGSGYHALLRLLTLEPEWTATLLLRKPEVIEEDELLRGYLGERLTIIQGDATVYEDVKRLFEGEKVGVVISSVGKFRPLSVLIRKIYETCLCLSGDSTDWSWILLTT